MIDWITDHFDHYTPLDEVEEDNELDYDGPDGAPDDEWECEFGNQCLMPSFHHRRSECYTVEMAEAWWNEQRAAALMMVLGKIEAWMAGDDGPLCKLWEDGDIGHYEYEDGGDTNWPATLDDMRNLKIDAKIIGGGALWPAVTLYREVLKALGREAEAK